MEKKKQNHIFLYVFILILAIVATGGITYYLVKEKPDDISEIKPSKKEEIITVNLSDEDKIKINNKIKFPTNFYMALNWLFEDKNKFVNKTNTNLLDDLEFKYNLIWFSLYDKVSTIKNSPSFGYVKKDDFLEQAKTILGKDVKIEDFSAFGPKKDFIDMVKAEENIKEEIVGYHYPTGWGVSPVLFKTNKKELNTNNLETSLYFDFLYLEGIKTEKAPELYELIKVKNEYDKPTTLSYDSKYKVGTLKVTYSQHNELLSIVYYNK